MKHDAIRLAESDAVIHQAGPPFQAQCVNATIADWEIDAFAPRTLNGFVVMLGATA